MSVFFHSAVFYHRTLIIDTLHGQVGTCVDKNRTTVDVKHNAKVRNLRRNGVLFLAPPCSTWVFLRLGFSSVFGTIWGQQSNRSMICVLVILRSQGTTKRSWWCPDGGPSKSVYQANVFVMRMMYLKPRCNQKWCMSILYSRHWLELIRTEDILCSSKRYIFCDRATSDLSTGLVVCLLLHSI